MTTGIVKKENGRVSQPTTSFNGWVDRFFRENLDRFFEDDFWGFKGMRQVSPIPVNVMETDKNFELQIVIPGLKREDFKISLDRDLLTIQFEKESGKEENDMKSNWLRREYQVQSFSRSFTLDETLDANNISASYRDGILYLTLPKKEGSQRITRAIEVK